MSAFADTEAEACDCAWNEMGTCLVSPSKTNGGTKWGVNAVAQYDIDQYLGKLPPTSYARPSLCNLHHGIIVALGLL